ncbi:Sulfotransferase family protein [Alkalispirochaeta americana]|uniref:Sulfotransferase family protein n=1 Tax=Alkalispirochaeta americana TaxID=159291 RepID=A0A1N6XSE0_9SPIO|nr:sulfotransferase family protein [Alkalispirochaeta americana]SIR05305.1 Sulfotransferase family protein [Alkalispirochaeta americana]
MKKKTTHRLGRVLKLQRNRILLAGSKSKINYRNFHHKHNVSIYPEYRLIYNRLKKSGNTTITAFLNDILGSESYANARDLKKCLVKPEHLTVRQVLDLKDYYSFSIVRNPYYRVLSAYLEKLTGQKVNGKYTEIPGVGRSSPEGFATFLRFLAAGGLYENRHWWPQVDSLFQPVEEFSFIGKLEKIVDEMGIILEANGLDPVLAQSLARPHEYELQESETRITSAQRRAAEFYSDEAVSIVSTLFEKDFKAFGYATDPEWS